MKRKLDGGNSPAPVSINDSHGSHGSSGFGSLRLDPRLQQAVLKEQFLRPTPIQSKVIPLALEGRDILARSKTGSGKTAAYLLPILDSILRRKSVDPASNITSIILVPTRELAQQVTKAITALSVYCASDVRTLNLTQKLPEAVQRALLAESPDIVIATPARAASNINTSALHIDNLKQLVIDEADLVLSYGYNEDMHVIAKAIPKGIQTFLISATLTVDMEILKNLFCRNPVHLELEEAVENNDVDQYVLKCAEDEKFLLAYVIFKLKLIKGKCIVFVGDTDRCYRLKLFFEQFGIKSCVLNSELPVNSRIHVVEEFNKNIYEILIAADEHETLGGSADNDTTRIETNANPSSLSSSMANNSSSASNNDGSASPTSTQDVRGRETSVPDDRESAVSPRKRSTKRKNKEYGISRGIDFKNVACVLNFDLPTTSKSYTHRVGRTARAGKAGIALSFVVPLVLYHKHKSVSFPSAQHDEEVLAKIIMYQGKKGKEVKPYHFDMKQVDAFRYRMNDALRAVTRSAIREARTRELRQELLKSEKLKRHFEENPGDLHHLRHDGELRAARLQSHLKHVPDYLMPTNGKSSIAVEDIGFVGVQKSSENRIRKARMQNRMKGKGKKPVGRKEDPLKTFNAKVRR